MLVFCQIATDNFVLVLQLACIHEVEASKTFEELEADKEALKDAEIRDPTYMGPPNPNLMPERKGLIYNQGRLATPN